MITTQTLTIPTTAGIDVIDISRDVEHLVATHAPSGGLVVLFVPGSTAALTTIEYESGAVQDLKNALEKIAPRGGSYQHNRRWGDGNGYAHVRAALMGPSLTIPLAKGRMLLGTWQQIVVCDFDNRARTRRVIVQVNASG
jgi:secondary thiamine-phosphate synthase enzyme